MDPAFIVVGGTLVGGFLIKGIETILSRKKDKPKELIAKDVLAALEEPVKDDWTDNEFVNAIHQRMSAEIVEYGAAKTICYCLSCNYERNFAEQVKRKHELEQLISKKAKKTWAKDGYVFKDIPPYEVPFHARLYQVEKQFNPDFAIGHFSWVGKHGGMMFKKVMGMKPDGFKAEWSSDHRPASIEFRKGSSNEEIVRRLKQLKKQLEKK